MRKPFAFGLILAALAGLVAPLAAADVTPFMAKKNAPSTLTGRVVFVDKSLKAVAVEIKGKILQINVTPALRISKGGKIVTFDELVAGQEVTLTFRETVQGHLEVVSVSVEASPTAVEAAGAKTSKSTSLYDSPGTGAAPNPANLNGQVRSPSH